MKISENELDIELVEVDEFKIFVKIKNYQIALDIQAIGSTGSYNYWIPKLYNSLILLNKYKLDPKLIKLKQDLSLKLDFENSLETIEYNYHKNLRPYQNVGVDLIKKHKNYALFWEMRTGKTPTSCVGIEEYKKVVVAVPSGLVLKWKKEFLVWTNRKDIFILPSIVKDRKKLYEELLNLDSFILIGSYNSLGKDITYYNSKKYITNKGLWTPPKCDMLVLDEAHFLRNEKTNQSFAYRNLRKYFEYALALTGTPAVNKEYDVLPILNFVYPNEFPKTSLKEYFYTHKANMWSNFEILDGIIPEKENAWVEMLNIYSNMIKIDEVIEWLPRIQKTRIPLESTPAQKQHLRMMVNEYKRVLKNGHEKREANVMTRIIKLMQIGVEPDIIDLNGKSAKTEFLKEYVENNSSESIIIWSTFTKYLKWLKKNVFKDAAELHGQLRKGDLYLNIDKFQNGETNILLANIKSGGMGHDLDKASIMIFVNSSYSLLEMDQAEARFMPIIEEHAKESKEIIYLDLVDENSMDSLIQKALLNKWSQTQLVNYFSSYVEKN